MPRMTDATYARIKQANRERVFRDMGEAITLAVKLYRQGREYPRIADELNRQGFKTRSGMDWTTSTVWQVVNRYQDDIPE